MSENKTQDSWQAVNFCRSARLELSWFYLVGIEPLLKPQLALSAEEENKLYHGEPAASSERTTPLPLPSLPPACLLMQAHSPCLPILLWKCQGLTFRTGGLAFKFQAALNPSVGDALLCWSDGCRGRVVVVRLLPWAPAAFLNRFPAVGSRPSSTTTWDQQSQKLLVSSWFPLNWWLVTCVTKAGPDQSAAAGDSAVQLSSYLRPAARQLLVSMRGVIDTGHWLAASK